MSWIKYPEKKPTTDIVALVSNKKGWMNQEKAIYSLPYDVWILYNPDSVSKLTLEITHYLPIPSILEE